MNFVKDLMLCCLFITMFIVVLIGTYLQNDLRSMVIQNDTIIMSQVEVIKADFIKIRELEDKIDSLTVDAVDLREFISVMQREYKVLESRYDAKGRELNRIKRELISIKIEYAQLEDEIKKLTKKETTDAK